MNGASFDGEAESETVVRGTFSSLSEWQTRLQRPYRPEPHSEMAVDDEDWPHFPLSTVAWSGLAAASDHLNAIRRHVEAYQLFPMAHPTLCRTALIGAAQTVWVLAPAERADRLGRSSTVVADLYMHHLRYLKGLQDHADTPHDGTNIVAALVGKRLKALASKRAAESQRDKLITTTMIEEAAESAFLRGELVEEVVLAWQSGSGAAHGLMWHLFGTPGMSQTGPSDPDGIAAFQAAGSLGRIANAYMAAYHLAQHGWKLLGERGSSAK